MVDQELQELREEMAWMRKASTESFQEGPSYISTTNACAPGRGRCHAVTDLT